MSKYNLTIGGKTMPTPIVDGVQITDEKIWSANTGRTNNGSMEGTLIAIKRTVTISWGKLTGAQAATIRDAVSSKTAFHTMTFTDIDGSTKSMQVYFAAPKFTIHRMRNGTMIVTGATVEGIEK